MGTDPRGLLLFRRAFGGLTGGHLKVWHYFGHADGSRVYRPAVHLVPGSSTGTDNPFTSDPAKVMAQWRPQEAAALFLAGLDWDAVPDSLRIPVINLIQGVRHADPGDRRRSYLARRAVRICVSQEVADAIVATGSVNGLVVTIPNAVDIAEARYPGFAPNAMGGRRTDLLLAGWKQPELAHRVAWLLQRQGFLPEVIDAPLPREEFLQRLADAATVVLLPLAREGCFLPALEAFALGCLVVCPDCVGNRTFCRDGDTCLVPVHDPSAIAAAAIQAVALPAGQRLQIVARARSEVASRGLASERAAFLALLDALPAVW